MPSNKFFIPKQGEVLPTQVIRNDKSNNVTMRNDLIRAVHRVDIRGKRLLMLAISRLDSRAEYRAKETETTITVAEYVEVFGSKNGWRDLKAAADNVFDAQIIFNTITTKGNRRYKRVRWVSSLEYCEKEAKLIITFSRSVLPYITAINNEFTSYKLVNMSALRSVYSSRLLDLLMQWKSRGMVEIDIETLHECLEVPESCKKTFGEMRRRVLVPAIRELEENANLEITWNPKRKGRKIASVLFGFTEKRQMSLLDAL